MPQKRKPTKFPWLARGLFLVFFSVFVIILILVIIIAAAMGLVHLIQNHTQHRAAAILQLLHHALDNAAGDPTGLHHHSSAVALVCQGGRIWSELEIFG